MNLYYDPAEQGCTIIADLDQAGSYEFDQIVFVKRDSDGAVFCATDEGCSCPVPFEDTTLDNATRILAPTDVRREVKQWWDGEDRGYGGVKRAEVEAFISKVVDAL